MTGARLPRSSLVVAISNMIHDIYARGNVGTYLWYNVDNRMSTTTHLQFVTIEQQINYFTTKTIITRCLNDLVSTQEWWTLRRYPLIWPVSRITFYDFAEPVRDRLSLEWQSLENSASISRVPPVIMIFHHPSWKLRCWNGSSVSAEIKFHHSCNGLIQGQFTNPLEVLDGCFRGPCLQTSWLS